MSEPLRVRNKKYIKLSRIYHHSNLWRCCVPKSRKDILWESVDVFCPRPDMKQTQLVQEYTALGLGFKSEVLFQSGPVTQFCKEHRRCELFISVTLTRGRGKRFRRRRAATPLQESGLGRWPESDLARKRKNLPINAQFVVTRSFWRTWLFDSVHTRRKFLKEKVGAY